MDLRPRLELAGNALLALLNPDREHMPTDGYEVAHDLGRWWDAALRLEEAADFCIPAELEPASLRNLHALTDNPDRLLMNLGRAPWLSEKAKINPHNFRESLLAFGGLVRRRHNVWARRAGLQLVAAMDRCLQGDGSLDLTQLGSWGHLPATQDPSHAEPRRDGWFDSTATSGRSLEALVWLYDCTGESRVLDVAARIAAHHLRHSTSPDGQVGEEILCPDNVGHDHSYLGTLRGLLLFGLRTGQREYIDAVEATYRQGVRGHIVMESGWAPHDLGKTRFPNEHGDPVADPASCGDAAQLALWLAQEAGCRDLLDDVERYVRARLIPAQLTAEAAAACPDREFKPRDIGAWCIHGPSHAGQGCTPDVLAAVTHSLCDIHTHIWTPTPGGTRVDLHFDCEDARLRVTTARGDRAEVTVLVKQPGDLMIRIPGWAPESSLRLTVNGDTTPIRRLGLYAWVPGAPLGPGGAVVLSYDLPERQTEELMPSGRRYRFGWRGDEIAGVDPTDEPLSFYPHLGADAASAARTIRPPPEHAAHHTGADTMSESTSHLFLDDHTLAEQRGVTRTWHPLRKHPANPLFARSGAETQLYLFGTVLHEPEPGGGPDPIFRMWYYAVGEGRQWTGYARSRDGLTWEKPDLDLFADRPGVARNAVFSPDGWRLVGLSGVIRDPNPDMPEDERYKLVQAADAGDPGLGSWKGKHYVTATSPDGLAWTFRDAIVPTQPCYPDRACFVWDPYAKAYVLYARSRHRPPDLAERGGPAYFGRAIGRGSSQDFRTWSHEWPQVMQATAGDPDGTEIYGWSAFPWAGQWVAWTQIHHSQPHLGYIDMAVSHSRDGVHWQRRPETVLPVGEVGDWDRFNQCTSNHPLRVGDEIWVYYSGRSYRHKEYRSFPDWRPDLPRDDNGPDFVGIGLATMRLDGWCSLDAGYGGGTVLTEPGVLQSGDLWVNAKADRGQVVVEVLDEAGQRLPGSRPSAPLAADGVRLPVTWPDGGAPTWSGDRPVRLRFRLENARLYSWGDVGVRENGSRMETPAISKSLRFRVTTVRE